MKKIAVFLTLILILISSISFAQEKYSANDHVGYNVKKEKGNYIVNYTFKDHLGNICELEFTMDIKETRADINKYGIPKTMFDTYTVTEEIEEQRKKTLENGLFKEKDDKLSPDLSALINYYQDYGKLIADWMISYLKDMNKDTRLDRIRLAMCFTQDIPYAIPTDYDPNWHYGGIIAPPTILVSGWGDCDTKAVLFASVLCFLIDYQDIRFAGEPGHLYTIIKNKDTKIVKGGKTTYFTLDDGTFLVAETSGPGRFQFGEQGDSEYSSATIDKINFVRKK